MIEAKNGFDFAQAANLGIEPIEPGETFQLTREIRGWEAKQILAMHPKGSHRWEMPRIKLEMPRITLGRLRDFAEISAHTLLFASATGLTVSVIVTSPVILVELGSSFLQGRSPDLAKLIISWGGLAASYGAAVGFMGELCNVHYPEDRLFRFGKSS